MPKTSSKHSELEKDDKYDITKKYLSGEYYYECFWVDDLMPCGDVKTKIDLLFIFESPHCTEIDKKIPVCGNTGENVIKALGEYASKSLGEFVKEKIDEGKYNIAIMNVCNVPLQKINNKNNTDKVDFEKLKIRRNAKAKKNIKDEYDIIILELFSMKLNKYIKAKQIDLKNTVIILCGRFAERFFCAWKIKKCCEGFNDIICLPHPAPHVVKNIWKEIDEYSNCWFRLKSLFKEKTSMEKGLETSH